MLTYFLLSTSCKHFYIHRITHAIWDSVPLTWNVSKLWFTLEPLTLNWYSCKRFACNFSCTELVFVNSQIFVAVNNRHRGEQLQIATLIEGFMHLHWIVIIEKSWAFDGNFTLSKCNNAFLYKCKSVNYLSIMPKRTFGWAEMGSNWISIMPPISILTPKTRFVFFFCSIFLDAANPENHRIEMSFGKWINDR